MANWEGVLFATTDNGGNIKMLVSITWKYCTFLVLDTHITTGSLKMF